MTLAKGITSGYLPLGATMVSEEIGKDLIRGGYFAHGFTYSGHPTSTAAALANLDLLERDHLIERVRDDIGPYFQARLRQLTSHPAVSEARGHGLIGALELVPRGGKRELRADMFLGVKAAKIAREEGVIVRGIRDLVAVSPPFIITHAEVDELFDAVGRSLDKLWK
jgi:putrescine aminotransferase